MQWQNLPATMNSQKVRWDNQLNCIFISSKFVLRLALLLLVLVLLLAESSLLRIVDFFILDARKMFSWLFFLLISSLLICLLTHEEKLQLDPMLPTAWFCSCNDLKPLTLTPIIGPQIYSRHAMLWADTVNTAKNASQPQACYSVKQIFMNMICHCHNCYVF